MSFRVPVPRKPPEDAMEDSFGRKWVKVNPDEEDDNYFVEWEGDFWYVWFQGAELDCPEEDETIYFATVKGEVGSIWRSYNTMRAVVEMNVYKDDTCK